MAERCTRLELSWLPLLVLRLRSTSKDPAFSPSVFKVGIPSVAVGVMQRRPLS